MLTSRQTVIVPESYVWEGNKLVGRGTPSAVVVDITVDPEAIAKRLAGRVRRSKSKQANFMHGAVRITYVSEEP
jgi:hypothetical protein